ncbi:unnamed protein product [Arctogadus glacialis]
MNSLTTTSESLALCEMLLNALGLSGSDDRNEAMTREDPAWSGPLSSHISLQAVSLLGDALQLNAALALLEEGRLYWLTGLDRSEEQLRERQDTQGLSSAKGVRGTRS